MKIFTKLMAMIFIISGFAFAQSNHSMKIDGTNHFNTTYEEFTDISHGSNTSQRAYFTWSADSIFFGIYDGEADYNNMATFMYFDTDPEDTNGTTNAYAWGENITTPFKADYVVVWKNDTNGDYIEIMHWNGSSWDKVSSASSSSLDDGDYKVKWAIGTDYREVGIARSTIGSPSAIKFCSFTEQQWGDNWRYFAFPSEDWTDANRAASQSITHYKGFTLDAGYNPNDGNSHDYVMRKNYAYLSFDGSDDYVKYSDDATLGRMDGATDYTIEAWIYPITGVQEYDRVLQRYNSFAIIMYDGDNDGNVKDWYFEIFGSTNHFFNTEGDNSLTLNAWNHIAVINNSSDNSLKLYVNGSEVTTSGGYSNMDLPSSSSSDNLYIGQKGNGSDYFKGYIDEVRLKNVAVSPSDLHSSKTDNAYLSDANTAGLFHFDEGSGTNTENVPSGTNATLNNGVAWETDVTDIPYPVELKSFTATVKGNNVELNWATATEINNYGFQVERKNLHESGWEEIGFVQGHGVSNSTKYYSYIDNPFEKGSYSYRLKQIDLDGAFKYSEVVTVDLGSVNRSALKQNYPNPFNPTTEISFDVPKESRVKLSVYNALGQKVADLLNEKLSAGTHHVRFDGSNLTSGIYFYRMQSNGFTAIKKMILMK